MKIAPIEACAAGECFDLTNIQGSYPGHYDSQSDGRSPIIILGDTQRFGVKPKHQSRSVSIAEAIHEWPHIPRVIPG
jgi:hypothetical protein